MGRMRKARDYTDYRLQPYENSSRSVYIFYYGAKGLPGSPGWGQAPNQLRSSLSQAAAVSA